MIPRLKNVILIISILLFILSLTQPAFYIDRSDPAGWANSLGLLLIGWSGALCGGAGIAWFANPLIIFSWAFFFEHPKLSAIATILATFFSASFLLFSSIISDEAGNYSKITARKAGYWLWLASIFFFTISSLVIYFIERNTLKDNKEFKV